MRKPQYIMIHHSAVSHDKNPDQFDANNNYHKAKWNFKSSLGYYLGYNYEIAKNGKVRQARADGEQTAACYQSDMNNGKCIHICLDGHFDNEKPEPAQIYALRDLLRSLVDKYNITRRNIIFHRDYSSKTCPGNNLDHEFIRGLVKDESKKKTPTDTSLSKEEAKAVLSELLLEVIEIIDGL